MPTVTLQEGMPEKLFNALTSTGDNTSSAYALPATWARKGKALVWQSVMNGSPSAISLQLQGAMNDVSAEYAVLDTSSATAGEMRHVLPINVRFVRVRQVSRTGGTDVTVQVSI